MLNKLSREVHEANKKKGFYDEPNRNMGEILALIHAEVSEALEAHRDGKRCTVNPTYLMSIKDDEPFKEKFLETTKDTFEDELADIIIRTLDLCGYKKVNIEAHIAAKLRYNAMRPVRHGKKY